MQTNPAVEQKVLAKVAAVVKRSYRISFSTLLKAHSHQARLRPSTDVYTLLRTLFSMYIPCLACVRVDVRRTSTRLV